MLTLNPRAHVVRQGQTLVSIAKAYGFTDWQLIYLASCNQNLRRLRPNPNLIKIGDTILIPPKPEEIRAVLQQRLAKLRIVRLDSAALFDRILNDLEIETRRFRDTTQTIDVIGKLSTLAISLGSLVKDGFKAMHLTGEALEKANHELAKSSLKFAYGPLADPALTAVAEKLQAHKGIRYHIGTAFHVLGNLTTPSYWAGVYTNTKDGKPVGQVLNSRTETSMSDQTRQIREQRQKTLDRIDQSIREIEQALHGDNRVLYDIPKSTVMYA
jgi:LysM domain